MSHPSSSPAPQDLLESLTIDSEMSSSSIDVRSRALRIRDILSSFDRDVLPSELKPHIFTELDRPSHTRPPVTQWTIQEDLPATLLQWGAYNDKAYELLTSLQSASTLARCFYEKIQRRFEGLFERYDHLPNEYPSTVRTEIPRIAAAFRNVVAAVREDRVYRELGQEATAARLLDALIGVCRRHMDLVPALQSPITPRRGTRRTASQTEGPTSLYEALITRPVVEEVEGPFMLDVLETFPASVFAAVQSQYSTLMSLLDVNGAPPSYKYRIGRLQSGVARSPSLPLQSTSSNMPIAPTSTAEASTSTSTSTATATATATPQTQPHARQQARQQAPASIQTSTAPVTRSKRTAEEISPIIRRGKKKPTQ